MTSRRLVRADYCLSLPWMLGQWSLLLLLACTNCHRAKPKQAVFVVPGLKLQLPALPGWHDQIPPPPVHTTAQPRDLGAPRLLLRLLPEQSVPGSPRIEVTAEAVKSGPDAFNNFVSRNLAAMQKLADSGQIHLEEVSQRAQTIGGLPAMRLTHRYTLNETTASVHICQMALLVLWGRHGIIITAIGRTELFLPQQEAIEKILTGLKLPNEAVRTPIPLITPVDSIDLGHIGGNNPN